MQCQSSVQTMMKNTSEQKRKVEGLGFSLFLFCTVNLCILAWEVTRFASLGPTGIAIDG